MYLGTYDFDGDPEDLVARYDQLVGMFPEGVVMLNVCVRRADGITVIDTCPSEADFRGFSTSAEFAGALEAVGLPTPRVQAQGEVHAAHGSHITVPA